MVATKSILAVVAISLVGLIAVSEAQVQKWGSCPKVAVIPNFNATKFMGLWYEAAKYPAAFETGSCVTANYTLLADGTVGAVFSQYNISAQSRSSTEGNGVVVDNAKLLLTLPTARGPKADLKYWVLHTDYENYSVVFSCAKKSLTKHIEFLWILTRSKSPSVQTIIDAVKVIANNKLSVDYLSVTSQDNYCKY